MVFDSSAKYQDVSFNLVLLQGPDMLNSLVGIPLIFRKEKVAVTMDVQPMFYNFKVPEKHRSFLRFIWHGNNNFREPFLDNQMTSHVFGNTASPTVSNYEFREVVQTADNDVKNLMGDNFYVDNGLLSCKTVEKTWYFVRSKPCMTMTTYGITSLHQTTGEYLMRWSWETCQKTLKTLI